MEFIDISLLTGKKADGSKRVTFEEMKAAPKVRVTADLQLVQDAENLAVLDAQLEAGYPMVSVSRDLPTKNYMDRPSFLAGSSWRSLPSAICSAPCAPATICAGRRAESRPRRA